SFICRRCNKREDCLNEFQICNSCKRMTKMTLADEFRLYILFESCKRCDEIKDCLNEFHICNSCHKRMKRMTPVGFRPNIKFETCEGCHQIKDHLNEFNKCSLCEKCERCNIKKKDYHLKELLQICNSCCKQINTLSGNKVVDDFIRYVLANNKTF